MGLLYGRAGRLTAENGDFWRGQVGKCRRLERGLGGVGIETVNMVRKTSHACAGMYVWANGVMTYCEAKREIEMAEKEDSTRSGGNSFDSFKPKSVAEWRAAAADEAKQGYKQQTPEAAAAGIKEMARQERLAKVAAEQRAEKASRDLAEQLQWGADGDLHAAVKVAGGGARGGEDAMKVGGEDAAGLLPRWLLTTGAHHEGGEDAAGGRPAKPLPRRKGTPAAKAAPKKACPPTATAAARKTPAGKAPWEGNASRAAPPKPASKPPPVEEASKPTPKSVGPPSAAMVKLLSENARLTREVATKRAELAAKQELLANSQKNHDHEMTELMTE
jgi:hypothetical protein